MSTLLAVDDSNTMRRVLEITFAGEDDLEVLLAASANEALGLLNERQPDLALIDVTLGDTDGYALCRELKQRSPHTPVILLSSKQHPFDPHRGNEVGADDHVDKPFDTQALLDRVRAVLEAAPPQVVAQPAYQPTMMESAMSAPASGPMIEQEPSRAMSEPAHRGEPIPTAPTAEALSATTVRPEDENAASMQPSVPPPPPSSSVGMTSRPSRTAAASISGSSGNGASALGERLQALGLTEEQVSSVLALSREVIEQAVWEIVPALAETLIKEEIARLTRE